MEMIEIASLQEVSKLVHVKTHYYFNKESNDNLIEPYIIAYTYIVQQSKAADNTVICNTY